MPASRAFEDTRAAFYGGRLKGAPTVLDVSSGGSNVTSAALAPGCYELTANVACHLRQVAGNTAEVTAINGHYTPSGVVRLIAIDGDDDDFLAGLGVASGRVWISRR